MCCVFHHTHWNMMMEMIPERQSALACMSQIRGDALVMYASLGDSFGQAEWEELDNAVYDELLEYFGQGLRPQAGDLRRLVEQFKAGKFRYPAVGADAGNGDDVNKDDGGEQLPGWG
jgi:hypothetical protein